MDFNKLEYLEYKNNELLCNCTLNTLFIVHTLYYSGIQYSNMTLFSASDQLLVEFFTSFLVSAFKVQSTWYLQASIWKVSGTLSPPSYSAGNPDEEPAQS